MKSIILGIVRNAVRSRDFRAAMLDQAYIAFGLILFILFVRAVGPLL